MAKKKPAKPAKKARPKRKPCLPGWWLRVSVDGGMANMLFGPADYEQVCRMRTQLLEAVADAEPVTLPEILEKGG